MIGVHFMQALPGGGQAGASRLGEGSNFVSVANNGDSVQLPHARAPARCEVVVAHTSPLLAVFGREGTDDTINGDPNGSQFDMGTIGGNLITVGVFLCMTDGAWFTNAAED